MDVRTLLRKTLELGGSELYLYVGSPPMARVTGRLVKLDETKITPVSMQQGMNEVLKPRQRKQLEQEWRLDYAYSVPGLSRFRVSLALHRGAIAAQFRRLPSRPPTLEDLGVPPELGALAEATSGLLLFSGPAGSGRSTTMAAVVDHLNQRRCCTIHTVEDPIEYLHAHKQAIVGQQEIGMDTKSFAEALLQLRRQPPEVLMLGAVPDAATLTEAIVIAEMGKLVLAPIRARGIVDTLYTLLGLFPPERRPAMAQQLAITLVGVVSQILVPTADGHEFVAAFEIVPRTNAVRDCVQEERFEDLPALLQTGPGMRSFEQSLARLTAAGTVSAELAAAVLV